MGTYTKWTACWGNATSIHDQTESRFAKNLTLRYPVRMVFNGSALRLHFSNISGTEAVHFTASLARGEGKRRIDPATVIPLTKDGQEMLVIEPGEEIVTDVTAMDVTAGEYLSVSLYLPDYTDMNAAVLITGCLSRGYYAYGNYRDEADFRNDDARNTRWYYFLNTIDILTEESNRALICYGDSITAQDWPDELAMMLWKEGHRDVAVIRRAISGTRILREYSCITYAAYGRRGEFRFAGEMETAGADTVLIQHGINDIIHPVGTETNIFRPWSDLPKVKEMTDAFTRLYIEEARRRGLAVYGGTLLPIAGWRTYADFREKLKNQFNDWLRTTDLLDGCVDFDKAVRDEEHPECFHSEYDSGDHLHPSLDGYKAMAECVMDALFR